MLADFVSDGPLLVAEGHDVRLTPAPFTDQQWSLLHSVSAVKSSPRAY